MLEEKKNSSCIRIFNLFPSKLFRFLDFNSIYYCFTVENEKVNLKVYFKPQVAFVFKWKKMLAVTS